METLERLGRRIESAEGLQGVVRTMKTMSALGVRRFEAASRAVRAYDAVVEQGLTAALHGARLEGRTAEEETGAGPRALVVIGADHGLCGRFDEGVAKLAVSEAEASPGGVAVIAVGLRLADRLADGPAAPEIVLAAPGSIGGLAETADALLVRIETWRRERDVAEVLLLRNVPGAEAPARPAETRLLPLSSAWLRGLAARPWPGRRLPMRMDARDTVLALLIRQHLHVRVYRALADSLAAEHAARLAVMQGAERNIADHLEDMRGRYRARRQESITTELLEVAAGYAALGGGED